MSPLLEAAARDAGGGIAVSVISPDGSGDGVFGEADPASHRSLTPGTMFAIASVTKTFVAALVLRLVERGQVDLDRPIAEYLPDDLPVELNGATVRQALGHRSGIDEHLDDPLMRDFLADAERVWKPSEVLALRGAPSFRAGMRFEYSNTNYVLLSLLVEHVTGRPVGAVMRDELLAPLGLDRIVHQADTAPPVPLAVGQADPDGDGHFESIEGGALLPTRALATAAGAAGGMAADAPSLARWGQMLYGDHVLSAASLDEMFDFDRTFIMPYGLGTLEVRYADDLVGVGHNGALRDSRPRWFTCRRPMPRWRYSSTPIPARIRSTSCDPSPRPWPAASHGTCCPVRPTYWPKRPRVSMAIQRPKRMPKRSRATRAMRRRSCAT